MSEAGKAGGRLARADPLRARRKSSLCAVQSGMRLLVLDAQAIGLFPAQHAIHEHAPPGPRGEPGGHPDGLILRLRPVQEADRRAPVALHVSLQHGVEHAGLSLPDMAVAQAEFPHRFLGRPRFDEHQIQRAHHADAIGARFAMHHHRIVDGIEQRLGLAEKRGARRLPGLGGEIDQPDAVAGAPGPFQPVAAAIAPATQIDDGANALPGEKRDVVRSRLA